MKKLAIPILLTLSWALGGCGTSTPSPTVTTTTNGNWEVQMTGGTGQASLLNFVAPFALTTNNGVNEPLDIEAGFGFINSSQCFTNNATQETVTGSATLNALSSGQVTGTLSMTITGAAPTSNVLTLTGTSLTGTSNYSPGVVGTLSNGVVTGTWTLTGPCTGSTTQQGNFLMCQGANKCTPP